MFGRFGKFEARADRAGNRDRERLLRDAAAAVTRGWVEELEPRALLSSTVEGYTPAEIRSAYGFDDIVLAGGIKGDGAGQTIAIVDAYNAPTVAADLAVFSDEFDLPAATLKVVNQTGGSKLPETDSGWAGEIALDVQWAHAIAPAAKILLVEANSADTEDLIAAVDYARHAAGVSVVSMSWGGSEFFSWGADESEDQTAYDEYFTTPAGHQGVTFVAASGDSGSRGGVMWPASSPNVIAVGGTSLYTDATGTYTTETGWSGTSSGYSRVEGEPDYQASVQDTGRRAVSDVGYNADPNTGFAVYDSLDDEGEVGWQVVGGTSAGAPQWAALVAIVNQGLSLAGKSSLDGATQTLPKLYALYDAAASDGSSIYDQYFNDVSTGGGSTGPIRWRGGGGPPGGYGYSGNSATVGYDLITGLGTPKAEAIVTALVGATSTGTGSAAGSGSAGGTTTTTGGTTTDPAQQTPSPLSAVFSSTAITDVFAGDKASYKLRLTNDSGTAFDGPVTVTLYLSSDDAVSSDDVVATTVSLPKVRLADGQSKTVKLRFDYDAAAGTYHPIAEVTVPNTTAATVTAAATSTVTVVTPTADLAVAIDAGAPAVEAVPGKKGRATVTITNLGNSTTSGMLNLTLYGSADATQDAADAMLSEVVSKRIKIKAGRSITLHLRYEVPIDASPSSFYLIASAVPSMDPADNNAANDVASVLV